MGSDPNGRAVIERATGNDLMQLATDVGPVPMQVGAVLVLDAGAALEPGVARAVLATRIEGVARLRQRLVRTGFGGGRPVWVDDEAFAIDHHLHVRACPAPGDDAALLACATEILGTRLSLDRPPWAATILTGLAGGSSALVVVFNHVLADGIGGLAVLAELVDGVAAPVGYGFPRRAPSWRVLALDAASARVRAVRRWRRALVAVRSSLAELRSGVGSSAPRCSLNAPTGARRATACVRLDLDRVHAAARAHGATVNDVVLTAVSGALGELLRQRGEDIDRLVVSVPVSLRPSATAGQLGNAVGVMPVDLPVGGDVERRLIEVGRITQARKEETAARGSSSSVLGPLFRAMAQLRVLRWFIDRQRVINTLVTNVHGPDGPLRFAGTTIDRVIPLSTVTGNVTVAYAALSYAGALTVTINADADGCPDLDRLTGLVSGAFAAIDELGVAPSPDGPGAGP